MIKRWQLLPQAPEEFIKTFERRWPLPLLQLFWNRGLQTEQAIERFLNPRWDDLHDPNLMPGMDAAVSGIREAMRRGERIAIFGHLDVDGVASAALLTLFLAEFGLDVFPYIPSRREGYGISERGLREVAQRGVKLIITTDCGINAMREAALASSLGFKLIITDHHEPGRELPRAISVLNPKLDGSQYPFRDLSGTGVAFKLVQALARTLGYPEEKLKWFADLLALASIQDIVPLLDENRIFTKFGLIVLRKTRRLGLQKLYEVAGLKAEGINEHHVGFVIAPRLNAPGRIEHASRSLHLLMTRRAEEAAELAEVLDRANRERQGLLEQVLGEAKEEIKRAGLERKRLIFVAREGWPAGIVGLVAGKLCDEYHRPAVCATIGLDQIRASARSIDAFPLPAAFASCREHLITFGGHKRAGGFSAERARLDRIRQQLEEIATTTLSEEDVTPTIEAEAELPLEALSAELAELFALLPPHGLGNPSPTFLARNARVEESQTVGGGAHLKLSLGGLEALFWEEGHRAETIAQDSHLDILYRPHRSEWEGRERLELRLVDLRPSEG